MGDMGNPTDDIPDWGNWSQDQLIAEIQRLRAGHDDGRGSGAAAAGRTVDHTGALDRRRADERFNDFARLSADWFFRAGPGFALCLFVSNQYRARPEPGSVCRKVPA